MISSICFALTKSLGAVESTTRNIPMASPLIIFIIGSNLSWPGVPKISALKPLWSICPWSRAIVVPSRSTETALVDREWTNVDLPASKGPVTSIFGMYILIPPGLSTLNSMDCAWWSAQLAFNTPKYWPKMTRSAMPPTLMTELKSSCFIACIVDSEYGQAVKL